VSTPEPVTVLRGDLPCPGESARQVAHVLAATQVFVDRHLQGGNHHGPDWPDFPPAALAPVRETEIPSR
jgi:hypothetical protein